MLNVFSVASFAVLSMHMAHCIVSRCNVFVCLLASAEKVDDARAYDFKSDALEPPFSRLRVLPT